MRVLEYFITFSYVGTYTSIKFKTRLREIVFPNTLPRYISLSLSYSLTLSLSLAHYYVPLRFYRFYPFYWQNPFFFLTIIIIAFPYLLKTFERFFSLLVPYDGNSLLYIHTYYIYFAVTIIIIIIIIIIISRSSSSSSQLYYIIIVIDAAPPAEKGKLLFAWSCSGRWVYNVHSRR